MLKYDNIWLYYTTFLSSLCVFVSATGHYWWYMDRPGTCIIIL